ncbi:hypothetical protein F4804DRAFT_279687 [Jackrogersella minutella]|nr:hypothetical protein F4804DRAFT_279687 [Jackrogersella minutella]
MQVIWNTRRINLLSLSFCSALQNLMTYVTCTALLSQYLPCPSYQTQRNPATPFYQTSPGICTCPRVSMYRRTRTPRSDAC